MLEMIDILTDPDTGDLACKKGDLVTGEATLQHQRDLLEGFPSNYKQFPATCVGIEGYLLDEDKTEMLREIRRQFVKDGMEVTKVEFTNKLIIRAQYQ